MCDLLLFIRSVSIICLLTAQKSTHTQITTIMLVTRIMRHIDTMFSDFDVAAAQHRSFDFIAEFNQLSTAHRVSMLKRLRSAIAKRLSRRIHDTHKKQALLAMHSFLNDFNS